MATDDQNMWNFLKGIPDLPNDGKGPPPIESMEKEPIKDGESPVLLQKIVTEVYVYTSANTDDLWYGAQSFQEVQLIGQMRLSEALSRIQAAKKRRRRK